MPDPRTPSRWPYRLQQPLRRKRVVKRDDSPRGVQARETPQPWMTPRKARVGLGVVALGALLLFARWLYGSPYLTVSDVEVTGASRVPEDAIVAAAGLDGDSTFGLDLEAAEARVEALPGLRGATVEKHGWSGVRISVIERTPWGIWQSGETRTPIDVDGYVLGDLQPAEGAPVIIDVAGAGAPGERVDPDAVTVADRLLREAPRTLGRRPTVFAWSRASGLTAVLSSDDIEAKDAIWVTFGNARDHDYKVATLYVLLEEAKKRKLNLASVDLRYGDRVTYREAGRNP